MNAPDPSTRRAPRAADLARSAARPLVALVLASPLVALAGRQNTAPAESAPASAPSPAPRAEPTLRLEMLDNGSFEEADVSVRDARGVRRLPWWRSARGLEQLEVEEGAHVLVTRAGDFAEQPIAAFAPLAASVEVRGRCRGAGRVVLADAAGGRAVLELAAADGAAQAWREFRLTGADFSARVGRAPVPRLSLRLEAAEGGEARWRDLSASVELPCPGPEALRAEVLLVLRETVRPWLERGLDLEGPLATGFRVHAFDAVTGERLRTGLGFLDPLFGELGHALAAEDVPEWRAAYERFLESLLEHGFEPSTGLPRLWDPGADRALSDRPVEIALPLGFLIDVAERGPERFRERARSRALAIGETVLAKGLLPDGNVAAAYYPSDGRTNPSVNQLRRFDVPAQLARLSKLSGDPRYAHLAGEALATFEFTLHWAGTWDGIDPGFDDDFGHYGARAATIALAWPKEEAFGRFALEGWRYYAPLWRDALRLGGNVAADQVRCWVLALDLARLDRSLEPWPLLRAAARSHFKGEQYPGGAWGDITVFGFNPMSGLQVGDYPGAPQNLLHGLAALHAEAKEPLRTELRAMYTAVLRISVETYRRPYGFLLDRSERRGTNSAEGSLRMLLGLRKMLAAL